MMPADPRFISFSLPAFHLSLTMLIKASLKPAWYLKLVDVRLRAWRRALSSLLKPAGIELPVVQLVQQWIHYNAHLTPCKTNTCAIQVGWALLHTCRALVSFVFRLCETTFSCSQTSSPFCAFVIPLCYLMGNSIQSCLDMGLRAACFMRRRNTLAFLLERISINAHTSPQPPSLDCE